MPEPALVVNPSAVAPATGTLAGSVTFKDGATALGTGTLDSAGQATCNTSALSVGSHSITAIYGGDINFGSSISSALTQTVNKASTTTTLSSSANPSASGQTVTFTGLRTVQGLRCLFKHQNKFIKLHEGDKVETIFSCDIIVANGQYFADGMQIAPHAKLNDGLLDVLSVRDLGRSELSKTWPKLYSGSHIGNPKIKESKTTGITIESEDRLRSTALT